MSSISRNSLAVKHYKSSPLFFYILIISSLFILYFSTIRIFSEFYGNPSFRSSIFIRSENDRGIDKLLHLIKKIEKASFISSSNSKYRNDKITLLLELYNNYNDAPKKNFAYIDHVLKATEIELINALFLSPANANYWYLLAEVRAKLYSSDSKLNEFVKMSYFLAPREGWIARRRLLFVLENWSTADDSLKSLAYKDIMLLWSEKYYQKHLALIFIKASKSSKKIIYNQLNKGGYKSIKEFSHILKSKGYNSKKNLLYTILF